MGVLNRFFGSTESIAKHAEKDEQIILRSWKEYLNTVPEKEQIINRLPYSFGQRRTPLQRLKQLLELELADVFTAEKDEDDIVLNLHSLEHSKKIKRVHKLELCLRHFEIRHEYVYELLRHLYSVLKSEARLLKKLIDVADLRKFRKFVAHLKSELVVEKTLLEKIGDLETFKDIFSVLVKGEHIIHRMDSKEKKLLKTMQEDMKNEGTTYQWVISVFKSIENKFRELEVQGILELHPDVHFELVNRPEFVDLVRETIQRIKAENVSEQMINVFVHIFREWYNHEID